MKFSNQSRSIQTQIKEGDAKKVDWSLPEVISPNPSASVCSLDHKVSSEHSEEGEEEKKNGEKTPQTTNIFALANDFVVKKSGDGTVNLERLTRIKQKNTEQLLWKIQDRMRTKLKLK